MLEDQNPAAMAAIPTPMPPALDDEIFTAEQWMSLLAICEVFVPAITSANCSKDAYTQALDDIKRVLPPDAEPDLADRYLAETVAGSHEFRESLRQRFARHIPKAQVSGLAFLLTALNKKFSSLVMTGSTIPLHTRDLVTRTKIVLGWSNSYIGPLRALYRTGDFLSRATWLAQSSAFHRVIDYPKVPKGIERHPSYDFKFLNFAEEPENELVKVEADVVIIGSGCGAGVVAEHLASQLSNLGSKRRILVLEKGYHFPSSHYPMDQSAAGENLQESGGGVLADNGSIAVLAGSTWGGGGTINWSASLQPQRFVREEWASKNKLPFALSQEFQADLDEVCDKMGVCRLTNASDLAKIEHNRSNEYLLEGARRLGLSAEIVPQNTAGKRHYCGRCYFGCASTTKQGPANFWLPAAAENGCEFIEGCLVEKIVWNETARGTRSATGVSAVWTSRTRDVTRKLNISAKYVVVSSGTLHSPLLLHRSGLTPEYNKHIGSNLHLHPVVSTRATYKERMDPWDGAILTSAMTSLENADGNGHGPKIEVMLGTPDLTGTVLPFRTDLSLQALAQQASDEAAALKSALDYKLRMARHGHSFVLITIQRDHAVDANVKKSYVYGDPNDPRKVKISYTPSTKDRECLLEGAITAARMHFVMGAETIEICSPFIPLFERPSLQSQNVDTARDDAAFEKWIAHIKTKSISLLDPKTTRLGSAHQMGTCRMSSRSDEGVVDPQGKIWGTQNVFVADASILPSASGVNPMVTTMGLSLHVAKSIVKEMTK